MDKEARKGFGRKRKMLLTKARGKKKKMGKADREEVDESEGGDLIVEVKKEGEKEVRV
jgi:hypothetical protein